MAEKSAVTRAIAIQSGIAALSAVTGVALLARPDWFGARSAAARYPARIAGMMAVALGLFLGGFAAAFTLAGGGI